MLLPFGRHYCKIIFCCYRLMLLPFVLISLADILANDLWQMLCHQADVIAHLGPICSMAGVIAIKEGGPEPQENHKRSSLYQGQ